MYCFKKFVPHLYIFRTFTLHLVLIFKYFQFLFGPFCRINMCETVPGYRFFINLTKSYAIAAGILYISVVNSLIIERKQSFPTKHAMMAFCCCLPCDYHSKSTLVVSEKLTYCNRLRSTYFTRFFTSSESASGRNFDSRSRARLAPVPGPYTLQNM